MKYYHITRSQLNLGTILKTGYYGNVLLNNLKNHEMHNQYMKEMVFEDIRTQHYTHMPQRLNCNYLLKSVAEAISYKEKSPHLNGPIYEVELLESESNQLADVDMTWLNCNFLKYDEIKQYAHYYWAGFKSDSPIIEVLYSGNIKLVEVVESAPQK